MKRVSLLIFIMLLVLFTGCDSTSKVSSVYATSFYGQKTLFLPIESPKAVIGSTTAMYFESNLTLEELYDKIKDSNQYQVEMGKRGILITAPTSPDNSLKEYYSICEMAKNEYCFNDLQLKLTYEIDEEQGNKSLRILFPLHCLVDPKYVNYYDSLYTGQEYEVSRDLEYFYEFYQNSGWLNVEKGENWLQINSLKAEPVKKYEQIDRTLIYPIRIYFANQADRFYITMQTVQ